jgi:hypothetical protein
MGTMGLGKSRVKGRTRVPCPAANIIPFAIALRSKSYAKLQRIVCDPHPSDKKLKTNYTSI